SQIYSLSLHDALPIFDLRDASEIEQAISVFAQRPNGGLIFTASQFGANHAALFTELAARHKLPAVYPYDYFVTAGGLISYGPERSEEHTSELQSRSDL